MENVNCLRCHFRHEDNGNCTAVGGFCTAAPAAHCPLLRQYLDTGMTPEAFQSFVVFFQDLIGDQKASEALDRFRQLAKADRAGRLVVLLSNKALTNADRMRTATNQQLAKQLYDTQKELCRMLYKKLGFEDELNFSEDYSDILAWLNAPSKEAEKALEAMKDGN